MQKSVVVTLASANHIKRAKQLFSSIYFNAHWHGDCALLYSGLSKADLRWFKTRNIVTVFAPPLYDKPIQRYAPVVSSKLHLFDINMKKWNSIIYLDTDIVVTGSLEELSAVSYYSAVPEKGNMPLRNQFIDKPRSFSEYLKFLELKILYDLSNVAFNAGVLAFPTSLITRTTLKDLISLLKRYAPMCKYSDQGIQNLYFYKRWKPLPEEYNVFPKYSNDVLKIKPTENSGKILHFADEGEANKPWNRKNFFYNKWQNYLKKADKISF